jgi:hypothetical protein
MHARLLALLLGVVLSSVSSVRAHENPDGCFETIVAIDIRAFRSDGVTPLVGPIVGCEQIFYQARISKAQDLGSFCAFSGGTFTLTAPDGVAHTLSSDLPCIGGTIPPCNETVLLLDSDLIPYTVAPEDVHDGKITAMATYSGGVVHDAAIDTPGLVASVLRTTLVESCDASTTVTTSSSTTTTTTIPKSTCASLKFAAATQLVAAFGECDARALKFGVAVRQECLAAAADSFAKSWAMAERRDDCLTVNDQATVQTLVGSCTDALQSVLLR